MRETQLRKAVPYDEARLDLMQHMEQLHSSMILLARTVVQLDKRMVRLESRLEEIVQAEENGRHRSSAASWRRRG